MNEYIISHLKKIEYATSATQGSNSSTSQIWQVWLHRVPYWPGIGFSRSHPVNPIIPGILNVLSLLLKKVFTFKIEQYSELFAFLLPVSYQSVSDFTISKPYGLVGIWIFEIKSNKASLALEIVPSRCPADVWIVVTFQEGNFVLLIRSLKNVPCPLVRHFYP